VFGIKVWGRFGPVRSGFRAIWPVSMPMMGEMLRWFELFKVEFWVVFWGVF